ncbi:DUF2169 family type VI secretion system accessory protein [Sorangium sp. So ce131]|uniref:DUF2169 family type VI secretion system accessory protein n=1 Tax=Sorangium sp. So ce131 TaxID=3133282 RepID=UPI003F5D99B1
MSTLAADAATALPGAAAAAVAWRAQGALHVTVIAKATFAFAPDAVMPRIEPQEILRAEVHHGDHPGRSVRFTTDLAPALARADVLFTGAAHAPPGAPVRSLPVRLALFAGHRPLLDKHLLVHDPGGVTRVPIVYERTGLGLGDTENPFGLASTAGVTSVVDPAQPGRPVGFGPLGRAWPARKRLLGVVPRRVLEGAVAEIPEGFDWAYFQAAPLDQRVERLRGDEWIILEGLHPDLPRLRTRLAGARGLARIHGLAAFGIAEGQPLELYLDTLRIDGDAQRCTVVCRRSFPVPAEAALAAVRVVAGVEVAGEPSAWFEPRANPQAGAAPPISADALVVIDEGATKEEERSLTEAMEGASDLLKVTLDVAPAEAEALARCAALPFRPGSPAPAIATTPERPGVEGRPVPLFTGTLNISPDPENAPPRRPALPFTGSAPPAPPTPFAAPRPPEPVAVPVQPPALLGVAPIGLAPSREPAVFSSPWRAAASGCATEPVAAPPREEPKATSALPDGAARVDPRAEPLGVLDLLWFDPRSMGRIRRQPAWRALLEGLMDEPPDPDIDDPALDVEPAAAEDRREIFEVLAHGEAMGDEALRGALRGAIRRDGRFVPPLVLVEGELSFPFEEIEILKATVAIMGPLSGGDDRLKAAVTAAREFLQMLDPLSSPSAAEGLTASMKEAYTRGTRVQALVEVEMQVDRVLLEHRRYQRRVLFGGPHLRCLLRPRGAPGGIPAYLPEALAEVLPMFQRFPARVVAEAHLPVDQREAHPAALKAAAVARVGASGGW